MNRKNIVATNCHIVHSYQIPKKNFLIMASEIPIILVYMAV